MISKAPATAAPSNPGVLYIICDNFCISSKPEITKESYKFGRWWSWPKKHYSVCSFHKPRAAGCESSSWRGRIHAPFGNQPFICVQLRFDSFRDSMASKPGVWSDWPWQSLGAWKVQTFVELDFIEWISTVLVLRPPPPPPLVSSIHALRVWSSWSFLLLQDYMYVVFDQYRRLHYQLYLPALFWRSQVLNSSAPWITHLFFFFFDLLLFLLLLAKYSSLDRNEN
jgi:hypothetical protein